MKNLFLAINKDYEYLIHRLSLSYTDEPNSTFTNDSKFSPTSESIDDEEIKSFVREPRCIILLLCFFAK